MKSSLKSAMADIPLLFKPVDALRAYFLSPRPSDMSMAAVAIAASGSDTVTACAASTSRDARRDFRVSYATSVDATAK